MSYKEAVTEIITQDNLEPILELLSNFILAGISVVIGHPIIVVKPSIERKQDANLIPVTNYCANVDYLFHKDKKAGKGSDHFLMVWNGIDYYAPTLPKEIVNLTKSTTSTTTHLGDAIKLIEKVSDDIPGSTASDALMKSLRYMRAAKSHLERAQLATSTASMTQKTLDVPVQSSLPARSVAKIEHKCVASTLGVAPPAKMLKESDEAFTKRKKEYEEKVALIATRDTCLGKNQCCCGEMFEDEDSLNTHLDTVHTDPKSWICPHCGDAFSSKGKLWQHVCHHMGKYKYYCDCKYFDKKKLDEEGNPIEQVCTKGSDEEMYILFHCKKVHGVGKAKLRCQHCNKPQISNHTKKEHEKVCKKGTTTKHETTDFCDHYDYSCRGKGSLHNHMNVHHPEKVGLKKRKCWRCSVCGKVYKSHSGAAQHDSLKKKGKKRKVIIKKICY